MNYSYSILYILIIMSNKIMTYKYTMDSVKISKGGVESNSMLNILVYFPENIFVMLFSDEVMFCYSLAVYNAQALG